MALFKIEKGLAADLAVKRPNTNEGYCYVTTDDGKFYIDTATGNGTSSRIVLNAGSADKLSIGTVGSEIRPIYFKNGIPTIVEDDMATQNYVDETIAAIDVSDKLSKSGDTMLGSLTLQDSLILTKDVHYGSDFPTEAVDGQIFFLDDDGAALPPGGTTGQVLAKKSDTNNDAEWIDIIKKASSSDQYWSGRDLSIIHQTSILDTYAPAISMNTSDGSFDIGTHEGNLKFSYIPNSTYNNQTDDENIISKIYMTKEGYIYGEKVYGAVYNDYAEYRELKEKIKIPYGHVVIENGDDTLSLSTKRLQGGGNICSDTFGFAIGETDKAKMPIAVSGRALVYTYENRNSYEPGDAVCTGPEGTVSKMTREEIKEYPDRIIGYVSSIPSYKVWGENNILVNNRIWIKVV